MSKTLTIIGGGATGLAAAYIGAKAGRKVRILEGSLALGGLLRTFEIGGNRLESYYHHFFQQDLELRWLLNELGLADKLHFHESTVGIYRNGWHFPFNGAFDLLRFKPVSLPARLRFAATSLYLGRVAHWQKLEDVSCLDWFSKYAGREVTEAIWAPLLRIKFGPYYDQVPAAWMVGRLSQRMQSRSPGGEKLGYVAGSLQVVLDALTKALLHMGVEIVTEAPLKGLVVRANRLRGVETPRGIFKDEQFLYTAPTPFLVDPLRQAGIQNLAEQLNKIRYFSAVCTLIETRRPLSDTYWLNIADPGLPFGGIIEHTNLIPSSHYQGQHITYLSRYFAQEEPIAALDNNGLAETMLGGLRKVYPDLHDNDIQNIHVFRSNTAAIVCRAGFSQEIPRCRTELDGLYLATMAHVYPDERSTNNSIRVAAEAMKVLGTDTSDIPRGANLAGIIGF